MVDDVFKAMLPAFSGKLSTVRQIIFADDAPTPEGAQNYEELLSAAEPIPDAMRGGDDVAGIFYTGGTTGQAKGVMLSHNNLISNAMNAIAGCTTTKTSSTSTPRPCSTWPTARRPLA